MPYLKLFVTRGPLINKLLNLFLIGLNDFHVFHNHLSRTLDFTLKKSNLLVSLSLHLVQGFNEDRVLFIQVSNPFLQRFILFLKSNNNYLYSLAQKFRL